MGALGCQIVEHRSCRSVIPRHEIHGDEEARKNHPFFVRLDGQQEEWRSDKEGTGDDQDSAVLQPPLETVRKVSSRERSQHGRKQGNDGQGESSFLQAEVLVVHGVINAPNDEGNAGERDANARGDHGHESGYAKKLFRADGFRARTPGRFLNFEGGQPREDSEDTHDDEGVLPAVACSHDAAERQAGDPAKNHAGSKNGLRHGAVAAGEGIGNQGLRGRGISGFADTDKSAGYKEEEKGGSEAAADSGEAPEEHARSNDFRLIEAIGQVAGGNTGDRQYYEKHHREGTEPRVADAKMLTKQRKEGIQHLAVCEVDKID